MFFLVDFILHVLLTLPVSAARPALVWFAGCRCNILGFLGTYLEFFLSLFFE